MWECPLGIPPPASLLSLNFQTLINLVHCGGSWEGEQAMFFLPARLHFCTLWGVATDCEQNQNWTQPVPDFVACFFQVCFKRRNTTSLWTAVRPFSLSDKFKWCFKTPGLNKIVSFTFGTSRFKRFLSNLFLGRHPELHNIQDGTGVVTPDTRRAVWLCQFQ